MSCMKTSVCTESSVEIVNPKDEISSPCTVKVSRGVCLEEEGTLSSGAPRAGAYAPLFLHPNRSP